MLEAHGLLDVLDLRVAADLAVAGIPDVQQFAPAASNPRLSNKRSAITLELRFWRTARLTLLARSASFRADLEKCCQAQSEDKERGTDCNYAMLLYIHRLGSIRICQAKVA